MSRISIVTISYNNGDGLEKTIRSVKKNGRDLIKFIVIDGGSIDNSLDILEKYDADIDYWVSEPDKGIADAFNKGIEASDSSYILMLNSGDELACDIESVSGFIEGADIVSFSSIIKESGRPLKYRSSRFNFIADFKITNFSRFPHQSTFVHKEIYEKVGGYDDRFKIRMDFEFFVRAYLLGCRYKVFDKVLSSYSADGISSQFKNSVRYKVEEFASINKNYNISLIYAFAFWTIFPFWIGRKFASFILRRLNIRK